MSFVCCRWSLPHSEISDIIKHHLKRASKIASRQVNDERRKKFHSPHWKTNRAKSAENKCYQCSLFSFLLSATFSKFVFNLLFRIEMQSTRTQRQFHLMTRRFIVFFLRSNDTRWIELELMPKILWTNLICWRVSGGKFSEEVVKVSMNDLKLEWSNRFEYQIFVFCFPFQVNRRRKTNKAGHWMKNNWKRFAVPVERRWKLTTN
jgi:hypothetical protein